MPAASEFDFSRRFEDEPSDIVERCGVVVFEMEEVAMRPANFKTAGGTMRILLAIDNSKYSEAATQAIASLIRAQDAEVFVLHVIEVPYVDTEKHQNQVKLAEKWVHDAARTLKTAGFRVDTNVTHLGENNVQDVILEFAAQWHPDLIVLGSHGRTGLRRFLIGSVSDAVSRHAPCSVLIVRMPSSECLED